MSATVPLLAENTITILYKLHSDTFQNQQCVKLSLFSYSRNIYIHTHQALYTGLEQIILIQDKPIRHLARKKKKKRTIGALHHSIRKKSIYLTKLFCLCCNDIYFLTLRAMYDYYKHVLNSWVVCNFCQEACI